MRLPSGRRPKLSFFFLDPLELAFWFSQKDEGITSSEGCLKMSICFPVQKSFVFLVEAERGSTPSTSPRPHRANALAAQLPAALARLGALRLSAQARASDPQLRCGGATSARPGRWGVRGAFCRKWIYLVETRVAEVPRSFSELECESYTGEVTLCHIHSIVVIPLVIWDDVQSQMQVFTAAAPQCSAGLICQRVEKGW